MHGYIASADISYVLTKGLFDSYSPPTQISQTFKNWIAAHATVKSIRWMKSRM